MSDPFEYAHPIEYGELQRTKRLVDAAVRLWELRQESPQYSSLFDPRSNECEKQLGDLPTSALPGSSRVTPIPGLALDSRSERGGEGECASKDSEADTARAERLVAEALDQLRWGEADLDLHRKGHHSKVKIARQLRAQTPMSYQWIADRLHMGTRAYVSNLLAQSK